MEYNNAFLAPLELGSGHFRDVQTAYREGYLDRPERKGRFASNLDMETLHSLSPEEGIEFVRWFYGADEGNYYLAADKESLRELVMQTVSLRS